MYDKIFNEIGGIKLDNRTLHKDLIFPSLEEALKHKDKFAGLSSAPSAKFANYVTIKLDDTYRVIIKGADHAAVRKEFLGDATEYKVSITFKAAEFHGYIHFTHLDTGINQAIGASVATPGAMEGTWIIRNDSPYDKKYFRGTVTKPSPKLDKASAAIEFLITEDKFLDIISKIDAVRKSIPEDNQDFAFIGNNCHHFSHKVYTDLGLEGHYMDFARAKHFDFNDRGIFWKFILAYPAKTYWWDIPLKLIWENPSVHVPTIINAALPCPKFFLGIFDLCKSAYDCVTWNWYYYFSSGTSEKANMQDKYGNNALHKAFLMNDIKAAGEYLKMDVSSNTPNSKGETALHMAARLEPSTAKLALLEKLIAKATDINQPDLYADNIPLTCAIFADDPDAINLLVKHGADAYFINGTMDSLGSISAEIGATKAAKALYEIAPEIFHYDNWTRQIPIHHKNLQGVLPITENPPPAKDLSEEHNIVSEALEFLNPLIEALAPNNYTEEN